MTPQPSFLLILVVELVRLYISPAGIEDSSLCREFFGKDEAGFARLS